MSQQNKTTLQSSINSQLADNTSGDISAADIRDNLINVTDSLLFNSGSQGITGSLTATSFTGSLQGIATTASYVVTAQTASYFNGAVISASYSTTASYALTAETLLGSVTSASYAISSSRAVSSSFSTTASYALTAETLLGSVTSASYAATASVLLGSVTSASYAATSSVSEATLGAGLYGGEIQFKGGTGPGSSEGKNTYDASFSWNFFTSGLNIGDPNTTGGAGGYYLAVGIESVANGNYSVAFGSSSLASGVGSFTHGKAIIAAGEYSHAEGLGTIASGSYQHAQGRYNTQGDSTSLMIIGNGTSNGARKDAFKVRLSGSIVLPTTQSTPPSWTGTDGEMIFATVTGNHRFYVWMAGAWRSGSLS